MIKMTRRQVSIAYYGRCAQGWVAKWGRASAIRMVREACEHSEVLGCKDVGAIMEVADGTRCA